jgi:hypothetical protein
MHRYEPCRCEDPSKILITTVLYPPPRVVERDNQAQVSVGVCDICAVGLPVQPEQLSDTKAASASVATEWYHHGLKIRAISDGRFDDTIMDRVREAGGKL